MGGEPGKGDWNYWSNLIRFLGEVEASWGYWALNPLKPANNEFESYGLVMDDWETAKEDLGWHIYRDSASGRRERRGSGGIAWMHLQGRHDGHTLKGRSRGKYARRRGSDDATAGSDAGARLRHADWLTVESTNLNTTRPSTRLYRRYARADSALPYALEIPHGPLQPLCSPLYRPPYTPPGRSSSSARPSTIQGRCLPTLYQPPMPSQNNS